MFECIEAKENLDNFIVHLERGYVKDHPHIEYCRVKFDAHADVHPERYGISPPFHILNSVRKRQREYIAGRFCCKQLIPEENVLSGSGREPVWPAGYHGSISHCANQAVAVVTRGSESWPGVDIELMDKTTLREGAELFLSSRERQMIVSDENLLVAFSAKESLFKALSPQCGEELSMEQFEIVEVEAQLIELTSGAVHFHGTYALEDEGTVALTFISAPTLTN